MLGDFVVRPFQPTDAVVVSALIATTIRESNVRDYPTDRLEALVAYFTSDKLRALAKERDFLVAVSDGAAVGTAAREGGDLATVFVDPSLAWAMAILSVMPSGGNCGNTRLCTGTRGALRSRRGPVPARGVEPREPSPAPF